MNFPWRREKPLRMVWKVEKSGAFAFLVGTAHFFPHRFEKALAKLIRDVETVLLEGPLDKESMERVVQYGCQGGDSSRICADLGSVKVNEINRRLHHGPAAKGSPVPHLQHLVRQNAGNIVEKHAEGVRPWMAFFRIWSIFLNWSYSTDLEAYQVAQRLGKKIVFLETVEEQVAALDRIPYERILGYLNRIEEWEEDDKQFVRCFLAGDVDGLRSVALHLPTRYESIIKDRDPVLFERMKPFLDRGNCAALVGVGHIYGIRKMLLKEGYTVSQVAP
jgi:uncharacterized protein YbaP (TraB family)